MKKIRKAVIPVAGLGTRFLPATKSVPKEMLPVVDKPIVQYAVEEAVEAGVEHIIFVTGRGKTALEDHFDNKPALERFLAEKGKISMLESINPSYLGSGRISYTRQNDPKGLGHAINCASDLVGDEPFAVLLPDIVFLSKVSVMKQMVDAYTGGHLISALYIKPENLDKHGIFVPGKITDKLVEIKGIVEKPKPELAPSNIGNNGRYILDPSIFAELAKEKIGMGGEIQLTEAIAEGVGKIPVNGYFYEGEMFDCGDKNDYLRANIEFALSRDDMHDKTIEIIKEINKKYQLM